jgi:hypothetical protein
MRSEKARPADVAARLARRGEGKGERNPDQWRRESFTLPVIEARAKAREWFNRFPKAAYMTEIEFWRELDDGSIEFTIRRLPSAD